jgi:tetratricopeptide (TPR) repeat protein
VTEPTFLRAQTLVDLDRYDEALDMLRFVVAREPDLWPAHCLRALCLSRTGRPKPALEAVAAALAIAPDQEWPHRIRANVLLQLGDQRGALAAAREAVRLAPELVECWYQLVHCLTLIHGGAREAQGAAAHALSLFPDEPMAHKCVGLAAMAASDWLTAEQAWHRVLAENATDPDGLHNLGVVQGQLKRPHAVHTLVAAVEADPADEATRRALVSEVRRKAGVRLGVVWFLSFQAIRILWRQGVIDGGVEVLAAVAAVTLALALLYRVAFERAAGRAPESAARYARTVWRRQDSNWLLLSAAVPAVLAVVALNDGRAGVAAGAATVAALLVAWAVADRRGVATLAALAGRLAGSRP